MTPSTDAGYKAKPSRARGYSAIERQSRQERVTPTTEVNLSVIVRRWVWNGQQREGWEVRLNITHPTYGQAKVRKSFKRKADADRYEKTCLESIYSGAWFKASEQQAAAPALGPPPPAQPPSPTLKSLETSFLEYSEKILGNKYSAVRSKTQLLRDHVLPAFGDRSIQGLKTKDIDSFKLQKLGETLSPKTINNALTVLQALLKFARRQGLVDSLPLIEPLRVPKPSFDYFDSREGQDTALVKGADPEWRPMVVLAMTTGLRQGELLALQWDCVDLRSRSILVRRAVWRGVEGSPKGGRERTVSLVSSALQAIHARRELALGSYVFHDHGERLTDGKCKWPLWTACQAAGLPKVGWHVLRHTFASTLVSSGVPLQVVQVLLGHSSITMTERYAHLAPKARQEGYAALEAGSSATWTQFLEQSANYL